MFNCLYLDDNESKLELFKKRFGGRLELTLCSQPDHALGEVKKNSFDGIVVDMLMPVVSGVNFLQTIIKNKLAPDSSLFILSTDQSDVAKIEALRLGICDYLSFDMSDEELILRLRNSIESKKGSTPTLGETLQFSGLELNLTQQSLKVGAQNLELTPIEARILYILFQNMGRFNNREELKTKIWSHAGATDKTLTTHVTNLRKKLKQVDVHLKSSRGNGIFIIAEN